MFKTVGIFLSLALLAVSTPLAAQTSFDKKHEQCIKQIAKDPELAYENALIWQSQGGGRRARHCVAMALYGLDHPAEAAYRLENLAKSPDGGTPEMRAGYYAESADMWLEAKRPRKAYSAASAGLDIRRDDADLRIERARAYAALGRWDYAETDLTSVLAFHPNEARALRYRADARLRLNKLDLAKRDIDQALSLDGENVDVLLVRGKINEALRLAKAKSKPKLKSVTVAQ